MNQFFLKLLSGNPIHIEKELGGATKGDANRTDPDKTVVAVHYQHSSQLEVVCLRWPINKPNYSDLKLWPDLTKNPEETVKSFKDLKDFVTDNDGDGGGELGLKNRG
jgi:hypothetical protein